MKHCTFPLRISSTGKITIERIEHEPCYERTIEDRLIGRGARAFRQYPECSRERGRLEFIIDSSSLPSKVESFRAISKIFENDAREARRNKLSIEILRVFEEMNRRNLERNKVRADISFRTMETTFLRDIRNFVSEENREKKLEKKKVKRISDG